MFLKVFFYEIKLFLRKVYDFLFPSKKKKLEQIRAWGYDGKYAYAIAVNFPKQVTTYSPNFDSTKDFSGVMLDHKEELLVFPSIDIGNGFVSQLVQAFPPIVEFEPYLIALEHSKEAYQVLNEIVSKDLDPNNKVFTILRIQNSSQSHLNFAAVSKRLCEEKRVTVFTHCK